MAENLERALARLKRETEIETQAAKRRKRAEMQVKSLEASLKARQAFLIGDTIRSAELTTEERRVIAGVLARRPDKPKDWEKLAQWLPAASGPESE